MGKESRKRRNSSHRATQADIARAVGVTQAAVSLVVGTNGETTRVSPRISQEILRVAQEMNYRPHPGARQLAGKTTGMIGVIVRHIIDHFHSLPVQAIEQALCASEMTSFIGHSHGSFELLDRYIEEFAYRGVDAVICLEPIIWEDNALFERLLEEIPHTVFYSSQRDPRYCIVDVDRARAVRMAVDHLVASGRKRIALATWAPEHGFEPSVRFRYEGYREELDVAGLAFDDSLVFRCREKAVFGPPSGETVEQVIEETICNAHADAVIVYDDYWALRLIRKLTMRGIRIPDDVAVMGIGNEPMGRFAVPSITTVDLCHENIAQPAVNLLERLLGGETIPENERIAIAAPRLVARESA